MYKFRIISYRKYNQILGVRGGRFIITEDEYVIKNLFFTVARYKKTETVVSGYSTLLSNIITFDDGEKEIDIVLSNRAAEKISSLLNIE